MFANMLPSVSALYRWWWNLNGRHEHDIVAAAIDLERWRRLSFAFRSRGNRTLALPPRAWIHSGGS
jgi:hypothetical protein